MYCLSIAERTSVLLFFSAVTFAFVTCPFNMSHYSTTDHVVSKLRDLLYILQRVDSKVTAICDSQVDNMCENVLRLLGTFMKIRIFNTNATVSFSKLNCLYFYSYRSLYSFMKKQTWLTNANYILLIVEESEMHRILPTLRNNYGVRRAFLFPVFTSRLYSITNTGEIKVLNLKQVQNEMDLFDVRNFGGQFLRVKMFYKLPHTVMGRNYEMMKVFAQYLNFTPIILHTAEKTDLFSEYLNGAYTGGMSDIMDGRSDIVMKSYFPQIIPDQKFRYTYPGVVKHLCIIVPKAERIPKYLVPLTCFPLPTWINIIGFTIIVCCARYAIAYLGWKKINYNEVSKGDIILTTISATLSIPLPTSQYRMLTSRFLLIIYLSCMNIMVVTFQASLVTLLSIPKYYEDINTIEQLKATGMKIQINSIALLEIIKEDPVLSQLSDQFQLIVDSSYNYKIGLFESYYQSRLKFFKDFTVTQENRTFDVHRLPECPFHYYTSYLIPLNFPFEKELNILTMRTFENGLHLKWKNDLLYNDLNNKSSLLLKIFQNNGLKISNRIFSFEDLEIAFLILISGLTTSILTFISELWYHKKKLRQL